VKAISFRMACIPAPTTFSYIFNAGFCCERMN